MTLNELITRVRSYTRDNTGTLFTASDVKSFINESIDRYKQINEFKGMKHLNSDSDEPILLPSMYHYSLALYSASRCFSQDEQHYLAQNYMDEFEGLYNLLQVLIKDGSLVITDEEGNSINSSIDFDGVTDVYFRR